MSSDLVLVDVGTDGVMSITLNRPERLNALSGETVDALAEAVRQADEDAAVRAIVVRGEGRVFCAGADITDLDALGGPHDFSDFVGRLTEAMSALARSPKPSVAAIHGAALGGGLELALACDLRVIEEDARVGVPEIKLGLLPGAAGTARLTRMLPNGIAKQMLLTGDPLSATDAARLGLVNDVVARGAAGAAAAALAGRLAALPPLALAAGKRLVDEGAFMPLDGAIALERQTVSMLFGTEDREEGVRAFLEKRDPDFRGR